jgi:hypothetical protein
MRFASRSRHESTSKASGANHLRSEEMSSLLSTYAKIWEESSWRNSMVDSLVKHPFVFVTKAELDQEYEQNDWEKRLKKCEQKRVDPDYDYAAESRRYYRQMLIEHYEGDLMVAFTIDYTLHDRSPLRVLKMLLVDGIRHIVP